MENWFNNEELLKTELADSLMEDEKKNHGSMPLRTKNVKLCFSVLKIFVKTKLITRASSSGLIIDHPKPNFDPINLLFKFFIIRLLKTSFLRQISFNLFKNTILSHSFA
jgi:hypothetical protein